MSKLSGFDKFQESILAAMEKEIRPLLEQDWTAMGEAVNNHLFDLPGPTTLDKPRTERQLHVGKTFQGFIEIQKSVDTLRLIETYIGQSPIPRVSVSPDRHLQFFFEAYLQESYVLQERLIRYLKVVERQFRKDPLLGVKAICAKLSKFILETLGSTAKIRGSHVHVTRAYDKNIDRLGTMVLLTHSADRRFKLAMETLLRYEGRKIRRAHKLKLKERIAFVEKVLNSYFGILYTTIFTDEGLIKYPTNLKP